METLLKRSGNQYSFPKAKHIGFIMDGNRTWARREGVELGEAYTRGGEVCERTIVGTFDRGVDICSFYVLSRQNVEMRSPEEIQTVLDVFRARIERLSTIICPAYEASIMMLGNLEVLPSAHADAIERAVSRTRRYSRRVIAFCVNFDGRDEIIKFVRGRPNAASSELASASPSGLPDLDLVIRTGGGVRLSNFMIWEASYAEIVTIEALWPDFDLAALDDAMGCHTHPTSFGA